MVALGPSTAAHFTARPCGLVDEGAAWALPTHLRVEGQ